MHTLQKFAALWKFQRVLIAVTLCVAMTATAGWARTWTSASGAVQIEAELIEKRADGTVVLKKSDGVTIETKPERFSASDQEFIQQWKPAGAATRDVSEGSEPMQASGSPQQTRPVISPEEKAAISKVRSQQTKAAVEAYEKKESELAATNAAKQKGYRDKLVVQLNEAMKEAAGAGKLDDALAIRKAIKALGSGQEPAVATPGAAASPASADTGKEGRPIKGRIFASCDDDFILCVNGQQVLNNQKAHQITLGEHMFSKGDVITVRANDIGGTRGFCCAIKMQHGRNIVTSPKWTSYMPKSHSEWWDTEGATSERGVQPGDANEEFVIVRSACGINAAVIWGTERVVYLKYVVP